MKFLVIISLTLALTNVLANTNTEHNENPIAKDIQSTLNELKDQRAVSDWTIIAKSPTGQQFTFHPNQPEFLTVTPIKQNNNWSYAIWEDMVEMHVYAQDSNDIWWTVARTDWDTYEPKCLSEPGYIDKNRMALDDMVSGELPDCLQKVFSYQ